MEDCYGDLGELMIVPSVWGLFLGRCDLAVRVWGAFDMGSFR